jgi:hypothetical protein
VAQAVAARGIAEECHYLDKLLKAKRFNVTVAAQKVS